MRGKVVHGSMLRTTSRITPAYAGKSGQSTYKNYECGDHPRLCGEKGIQKCRCWYGRGSPPPMRGKAALPAVPLLRSGITPAYAGKSYAILSSVQKIEDHPRLCGEKEKKKLDLLKQQGSPPPMRGKALEMQRTHGGSGITPAYAGKSEYFNVRQIITKDHPRLCGEKFVGIAEKSGYGGSPPPMRGKVFTDSCGGQFARITPAYAGKSGVLWIHDDLNLDHPRLCGEKHLPFSSNSINLWITPAYAGKSCP